MISAIGEEDEHDAEMEERREEREKEGGKKA